MNVMAAEFKMPRVAPEGGAVSGGGMRAVAPTFVPASCRDGTAINMQCWSDEDEVDDEEDRDNLWDQCAKTVVPQPAVLAAPALDAAGVCAWLNDNFSDFSDSDSEEESAPLGTSTVRESWRGHPAVKDTGSASSSGSTS